MRRMTGGEVMNLHTCIPTTIVPLHSALWLYKEKMPIYYSAFCFKLVISLNLSSHLPDIRCSSPKFCMVAILKLKGKYGKLAICCCVLIFRISTSNTNLTDIHYLLPTCCQQGLLNPRVPPQRYTPKKEAKNPTYTNKSAKPTSLNHVQFSR